MIESRISARDSTDWIYAGSTPYRAAVSRANSARACSVTTGAATVTGGGVLGMGGMGGCGLAAGGAGVPVVGGAWVAQAARVSARASVVAQIRARRAVGRRVIAARVSRGSEGKNPWFSHS